MSTAQSIAELKNQLKDHLVEAHQLTPPEAISTGCSALDQFFLWKGWPKGELSLIYGPEGLGPTSLWLQSLPLLSQQGLSAGWINSSPLKLCPWGLHQKNTDLSKIFTVEADLTAQKIIWVLQEMMSTSVFELIGCHWHQSSPQATQIQKIKRLAQRYQCAVVILSHQAQALKSPFYAAIIQIQKNHICIERALHRPTPHFFQRRSIYENPLSQLAAQRRPIHRRALSQI